MQLWCSAKDRVINNSILDPMQLGIYSHVCAMLALFAFNAYVLLAQPVCLPYLAALCTWCMLRPFSVVADAGTLCCWGYLGKAHIFVVLQ